MRIKRYEFERNDIIITESIKLSNSCWYINWMWCTKNIERYKNEDSENYMSERV
jgi:hypothetical protein